MRRRYHANFDLHTPQLHLLPHWNWQMDSCTGQGCTVNSTTGEMMVRVWAYTNCDQVQLTLPNGSHFATTNVSKFSHAEWMVPYSAGRLAAQCVGEAAEDYLVTAGVATTLRATIKVLLLHQTYNDEQSEITAVSDIARQ